jgi:uncharacterized protein (AIM24 family)
MAHLQLGQTTAQIIGNIVPSAEFTLGAGEGVYFSAHNLLWRDPDVNVTDMPMKGAWSRMRAGLPVYMLEARGPGKIAFSHDNPGEMIAVPIQPGQAVDVRAHVLVAASLGTNYDWYESGIWFSVRGDGESATQQGGFGLLKMGLEMAGMDEVAGGREGRRDDETRWVYPVGQHVDRFVAGDKPGLVLVQAGGNAFVRDLAEGEHMLIKPPSLLYKDPTVAMQLHVEFPAAGMKLWKSWGNRYLWLRVWGPGRVAIQSSYDMMRDPGNDFHESCQFTQHLW